MASAFLQNASAQDASELAASPLSGAAVTPDEWPGCVLRNGFGRKLNDKRTLGATQLEHSPGHRWHLGWLSWGVHIYEVLSPWRPPSEAKRSLRDNAIAFKESPNRIEGKRWPQLQETGADDGPDRIGPPRNNPKTGNRSAVRNLHEPRGTRARLEMGPLVSTHKQANNLIKSPPERTQKNADRIAREVLRLAWPNKPGVTPIEANAEPKERGASFLRTPFAIAEHVQHGVHVALGGHGIDKDHLLLPEEGDGLTSWLRDCGCLGRKRSQLGSVLGVLAERVSASSNDVLKNSKQHGLHAPHETFVALDFASMPNANSLQLRPKPSALISKNVSPTIANHVSFSDEPVTDPSLPKVALELSNPKVPDAPLWNALLQKLPQITVSA